MKFRKLRIAWSVFWGVTCVLIVILWLRSVNAYDAITTRNAGMTTTLGSSAGKLWYRYWPQEWRGSSQGWRYYRQDQPVTTQRAFAFQNVSGTHYILFPHWVAGLLFATCAAMPWPRYRFSLRTLLIATTLVAVVLGLVVWLSH